MKPQRSDHNSALQEEIKTMAPAATVGTGGGSHKMDTANVNTSRKEELAREVDKSRKRTGELAEGMALLKEAIEGKNKLIENLSERLGWMESHIAEKEKLLESKGKHVAFLEDQLSVEKQGSSQPRRPPKRKRGKLRARKCAGACGLIFPVLVATYLLTMGYFGSKQSSRRLVQTLQEHVSRLERDLQEQVEARAVALTSLASCDRLSAEKSETLSAQEEDIAKKDRVIFETEDFFSKVGRNLNRRDKHWRTLLHIAVIKGRLDFVRALLLMGANVHALDDWDRSPLHWAAARGHTEIVRELLEKGAFRFAEDKEGRTPKDLAHLRYPQRKDLHFLLA